MLKVPIVRRPVRESHFGGLTAIVLHKYVLWYPGGGSCSPFSSGSPNQVISQPHCPCTAFCFRLPSNQWGMKDLGSLVKVARVSSFSQCKLRNKQAVLPESAQMANNFVYLHFESTHTFLNLPPHAVGFMGGGNGMGHFARNTRVPSPCISELPLRLGIGIQPETSKQIGIEMQGNSSTQFRMNSNSGAVWMGL